MSSTEAGSELTMRTGPLLLALAFVSHFVTPGELDDVSLGVSLFICTIHLCVYVCVCVQCQTDSFPCIQGLIQRTVPGSDPFRISAASSASPLLEMLPALTECSEAAFLAF